jgi:hypothetical protein
MTAAPAFPQCLQRFAALFNTGRYFESHEALERAWVKNRSAFYKGLIIYASAFVHLQRGNLSGAVKQLGKVPRYLSRFRPGYLGVDVDGVLDHAGHCRNEAARSPATVVAATLLDGVPPLTLRAALYRGDEDEAQDVDNP